MTSAFPKQMDELIVQAQQLCRELGAIPSQNKLKAALHVRAERAKAVLEALRHSGFDPTKPEPSTDAAAARWFRSVDGRAAVESTTFAGSGTGSEVISGTLPVASANAEPVPAVEDQESSAQFSAATEPVPARPAIESTGAQSAAARRWPVLLLAAPAFVAIWSGWVGVGVLTGFGPVHPLPGIANGFTINSAITLPIGVETYAAYALRVWLAGTGPARAQRFAKRSAIAAFVLGALGQIAYHLMTAAHLTVAPWPITTAVSCLPVVVLGFGAALAHLQGTRKEDGR